VMREADFARPRHAGASTYHSGARNRMMRRAEWPLIEQPAPALDQPRDAMHLGSLNRFDKRERRQNPSQALGQHGFAGTGRPNHQDVMRPGGRHFQRAFRHGLAAHVAEIGRNG